VKGVEGGGQLLCLSAKEGCRARYPRWSEGPTTGGKKRGNVP